MIENTPLNLEEDEIVYLDNEMSLEEYERNIKTLLEEFPKDVINEIYAEEMGYSCVPVDILTFIDDDYYLGKLYKKAMSEQEPDKQATGLWQTWRNALAEIFPNPFVSQYLEVIATGAIGIGKTTMGIVGMMYDVHRVLCLSKPHDNFGLIPSTQIVFSIFSANLTLGGDVIKSQIDEILVNSPYFKEKCKEAKELGFKTTFPNNIDFIVGSRSTHGLGRAVIGGIQDEGNFQKAVKNQANQVYSNLRKRIRSRFLEKGGTLPARLWLLSSRNDQSDFLDSHIAKVKGDSDTIIFEMPIWDAVKGTTKDIYCGETFEVFIGDETTDPFIMTPEKRPTIDSNDIMDFPIEFMKDCKLDLPDALRDLGGVSTTSKLALFKSIKALQMASSGILIAKQRIIVMSLMGDDKLMDYIDIPLLKQVLNFAKSAPRFIHCDLALTGDKASIASTFIYDYKTIKRINASEGKYEVFEEPILKNDFVIYIEKKPGEEIPLYKILDFVVMLRSSYGVNINTLSCDGFQSADMLQRAKIQNINTQLYSVDRTTDAFLALKNMVMEERITFSKHDLLFKELKELVKVGHKYDHPDSGCFVGDTKITCKIDGKLAFMQIMDLVGMDNVEILSYNFEKEIYEFQNMVKAWETKIVEELTHVYTSNGDEFVCTTDHKILILDKMGRPTYRQASSLITGDILSSYQYIEIRAIHSVNNVSVPVYDIEVENNHNFVLCSGVVCHNSKDGADALAGSAYLAYVSKTQPAMRNNDMIQSMNKLTQRNRIKDRLFGRR